MNQNRDAAVPRVRTHRRPRWPPCSRARPPRCPRVRRLAAGEASPRPASVAPLSIQDWGEEGRRREQRRGQRRWPLPRHMPPRVACHCAQYRIEDETAGESSDTLRSAPAPRCPLLLPRIPSCATSCCAFSCISICSRGTCNMHGRDRDSAHPTKLGGGRDGGIQSRPVRSREKNTNEQ